MWEINELRVVLKNHPPSHIYSDSLGMEEPISLGYVLINPSSHIKRNLGFYLLNIKS